MKIRKLQKSKTYTLTGVSARTMIVLAQALNCYKYNLTNDLMTAPTESYKRFLEKRLDEAAGLYKKIEKCY